MPLIYDSNSRIFIKQDYQKHSGKASCSSESAVEAFHTNHFVSAEQFNATLFAFDTPSYYTKGGTLNYYSQDYWSVYTNISRPYIKFVFTANTKSFGTGTTIKHDVYKIPYKDYKKYTDELNKKAEQNSEDCKIQSIEEASVVGDAATATTKRITLTSNRDSVASKVFPQTVSCADSQVSKQYSGIESLLINPILTVTATTSGISTSVYDLFLEEYQKKFGGYQYQLFEDYAQYFITTQFEFSREQAVGLDEFYQLDDDKNLVSIEYQQYYEEITPTNSHTITGGTFSGITVHGNFFTYFLIPNKPKWESPYVTGSLNTFAPTFFWSNTDDGDSYLLQVVYESGDCQSFSGTVYSYPIEKDKTNLSTNEILNSPSGDWSITQETTDVVRQYSVPLKVGKDFWYRIANVKELVNIFGVKQKVYTFSDISAATITSTSYRSKVYVQADSSHMEDISEMIYPEYLDDIVQSQYTLSGSVSGSVVTGATMQLVYPNGNYETKLTDSVGNFYYTELEGGIHTLNTFYRGYLQDTRTINITANTVCDVIYLKLIWGNRWDTWGAMGDKVFGID